jgi:excisionase family DNA binding protein
LEKESVIVSENQKTAAIDPRTAVGDLPQYLTVDEIAAYLRISKASAYALARTHGVRIGNLLRVRREAL